MFPATYPVQKGETADDLVQYMVDTFDHYAAQLDLTKKAALLHYSPYQVLEVASIIEREAEVRNRQGTDRQRHLQPPGPAGTPAWLFHISLNEDKTYLLQKTLATAIPCIA